MILLLEALGVFVTAILSAGGLSENFKCYAGSATQSGHIFLCSSSLFQPVCLVCNASLEVKNVVWYINDTRLTLGGSVLRDYYVGDIDVNQCDSEKHTLRLTNTSTRNHNQVFTCVVRRQNVTRFKLNLQASVNLFITSTNILNGRLLLNKAKTNGSVQCTIQGAVPPFQLMWSLDETVQQIKTFEYLDGVSPEIYLNLSYLKRTKKEVLTCSCEGRYISRVETSILLVDNEDTASPRDVTHRTHEMKLIWVSLAAVIMLFVIVTTIRGLRARSVSSQRNDQIQNELTITQGETSGFGSEPHYYDENFEEHDKNVLTTCLDTKVSVHGLHEYWSGTFSVGGTEQGKCFAKQFSDQGTLQEASEFKLLARKLMVLKTSEHVVRLLSLNMEREPFSIIYEFLEFGSLRDFVMTRYRQLLTNSEDRAVTTPESQVQELLTFAFNIAKAMTFIESQKFCHPFLSLRKVLLTSQCLCKLYDIHPHDMAIVKVKQVLKKKNPPVAWMAPETMFLSEYTPSCDAWSFCVLLWELFSLGDTPYAGCDVTEIERNVREGKRLRQPPNCPGSVYQTMLMSWQRNVERRPSFVLLQRNIKDALEATQAADGSNGRVSSMLNRSGSGDFI